MARAHKLGERRWWSRINVPMAAATIATALCMVGYVGDRRGLWRVPGLHGLELITVDARFQIRGERSPARDDIVIVGLDDDTRRRMPRLFQTRRGYAELVSALDEHDPRAIGLDLFFSAPEVTLSPETAAEVRSAHERVRTLPASWLWPAVRDARDALGAVVEELRGDELLAEAVADADGVVLGVLFHMADRPENAAPRGADEPTGLAAARFGEAVEVDAPRSRRPPAAAATTTSLPAIARGADTAGAANVLTDPDGKVRRVYGVVEHGGRFYMPLGLAMALQVTGGADTSYVVGQPGIGFGERELPASPRGVLTLSYLGGVGTFPHISAADVVAGEVPTEALADKLVFVGLTGAAQDKVPTPFDEQLPGTSVHATLAHNILEDELMRYAGSEATLLAILALGLAITALQLRRLRQRRAWLPGVGALVAVAAYFGVAFTLFASADLIVAVAWPVSSALLITLAALASTVVTEGREKARLRTAFSQYVNDTIVERIIADPRRATLGGERRELTVLFSDIRGFSGFSEKLEPEKLSTYLNEYLTPMTDLVLSDGGMLDKYIGDAVMAVYGAPIDQTDHAERACHSALQMLRELRQLNEHWRARGLPEISIGIGLNTGPMSVGNMGSQRRFDYTVMGDAVNLGARLEALTKPYMTDVLAGERTAEAAREAFVFRELDWVRVKGRDRVASIYELIGRRGETEMTTDDLGMYAEGLARYRERDWDRAEAAFAEYLSRHPADGPAHVMRDRVADLRRHPPPAGWDGVYVQMSK